MPAAMAQDGMPRVALADGNSSFGICGNARCNAPSAGQIATHSRQPVHSADLMVMSLSTGRFDGQTLAHFTQSMHGLGSRLIRSGLSSEANPSSAPYGHR